MKIENPMRFVREMKGAPLSIIMLLTMTKLALTNAAICAGTGYSDKSVSNALEYLEEIGIVTRAAKGWKISDAVQMALPLEAEELDEGGDAEIESNPDNNSTQMRKFSDSSIVNSNSIKDLNIESLTTINYLDLKAEKAEKFRLNLEAFRECGISSTTRTRELAGKDYVDPLYILAHVEQVRREGQKIGLAIWRMEDGQEKPLRRLSNGHLEGCRCEVCKYAFDLEVMTDDEESIWYENRSENGEI